MCEVAGSKLRTSIKSWPPLDTLKFSRCRSRLPMVPALRTTTGACPPDDSAAAACSRTAEQVRLCREYSLACMSESRHMAQEHKQQSLSICSAEPSDVAIPPTSLCWSPEEPRILYVVQPLLAAKHAYTAHLCAAPAQQRPTVRHPHNDPGPLLGSQLCRVHSAEQPNILCCSHHVAVQPCMYLVACQLCTCRKISAAPVQQVGYTLKPAAQPTVAC